MNSSNWLLFRTAGPWCHSQLKIDAMHIDKVVWTWPTTHLPLPNGLCLQCFKAKDGNMYARGKLFMYLMTFHPNYFLHKRPGSTVSLQCILMDQTRWESELCVLLSPLQEDFLWKHPIAQFCFLSPWEIIHERSKFVLDDIIQSLYTAINDYTRVKKIQE